MRVFKYMPKLVMLMVLLAVVVAVISFTFLSPHLTRSAHADANANGAVFASSNSVPLLQFPEGITSWNNKVYVATYNVNAPSSSRIFVFDAGSGKLLRTIGGQPGQELVSANVLLGLTIDHKTGGLYVGANGAGQILRIENPESTAPKISIYATYPSGGGPEDLVFFKDGTLFASDSNLGAVYSIPLAAARLIL